MPYLLRTTGQKKHGLVSDAAKKNFDPQENDLCRQNLVPPVPDPNYTVRA